MMFFRSIVAFSAFFVLASAMTLERGAPLTDSLSIISHQKTFSHDVATTSSCEKEDEDDCKEFCGLSEQTSTCSANGNKITCSCKGGKSGSNCEERCLLCMPDKSALEEAKSLFKLGGSRVDEL